MFSFDYSSPASEAKAPTQGRILVVEDDMALNEHLTDLLRNRGYQVSNTACGEQALELLKLENYDLILLDVDLPKVDGFSILKFVHEHSQTPVIMLTAYGAEEHRIRGFKSGADDYISKPCSFTEISLRVEAVLRRTKAEPVNQAPSHLLQHQELTLDRFTQTVSVTTADQVHTTELTPIQFKLLWVLVQNAGAVQTKPFLYQTILEREFSQYDRSLDMHLSRVRKKLLSFGMSNERIQTVHGKGYIVK
ncbi:response regulator transcription factor [Vibrio sp. D404a]|uniref:response regulator transcription factor n=1 Tax=unclassified Vibrio TaxID=2614977 RepID=UPI002556A8DE|nr:MULTISPECIES: response regulator transcription factor [unclassified Vibrio]MDK9737397.1 response regulator transcription factor [Vibrio sp. D404a]MDK9797927.1 response regulator transcription factor [Vibrio sp. D449a]